MGKHNLIHLILNSVVITAHLWCVGYSISINAYGSVGGKGQGSSLQEGVSHTYILKLG